MGGQKYVSYCAQCLRISVDQIGPPKAWLTGPEGHKSSCLEPGGGPAEGCLSVPLQDRSLENVGKRELCAGLGPFQQTFLSHSNGMENPAHGPMSKYQTGCVRVQVI